MTKEDIENILHQAATLRMPRFRGEAARDRETGDIRTFNGRQKIEELEDFLLGTARWRSFLEEARLHAFAEAKDLRRRWKHMSGWEDKRREGEKTVASVEDAKRATDPQLHDDIEEWEWLIKRLSEQIRRLEHDDEVASRAYTFITGGG